MTQLAIRIKLYFLKRGQKMGGKMVPLQMIYSLLRSAFGIAPLAQIKLHGAS